MRYEPDLFLHPFGSLSSAAKSRTANAVLAASLLAASIGLAASAWDVKRAADHLRAAYRADAKRDSEAQTLSIAADSGSRNAASAAPDFTSDLPSSALDDPQIRFVTKLASEQAIVVQQIQAEPLKADPGHLGQHRLTLQLRGDYRDIKNVWIALLAKFPGLTLERLTVRHHAGGASTAMPVPVPPGGALPPADRSDDEATIEMIQYLQPAKVPS